MNRPIRVTFCWSVISGYMAACWKALADRRDIDLHVIAHRADGATAFDDALLAGLSHRLLDGREATDAALIGRLVSERQPDVVVTTGWWLKPYRELIRSGSLPGCRFVMGVDSPWVSELQYLTHWRYRSTLRRVDHFMVTGERSWQYVRRLGISPSRISRGMYGVDTALWATAAARRQRGPWPRRFVFIGRYETQKGVDLLAEGFSRYRKDRPKGWDLVCCGLGPERRRLEAVEGITVRDFVQPQEMIDVVAQAGALVLASRFDPWPLVVVEAAAAGLPILCSDACGSAVEVVRPLYNGMVVATGSADEIARGMREIEDREADLPTWGTRSMELAAPYAAPLWADRWTSLFERLTNRSA